MRRAPDAARATLLALLGCTSLCAQATLPSVEDFRTPDGSRFVLVPDPGLRHVVWAVATPADPAEDAPGLEWLGAVTAAASLGGTWSTGSLDADRERQALEALDAAWSRVLESRGSAAALEALRASEQAARELGDATVFPRVLASLPADRAEVLQLGPATVFVLATVAEALGDVADLLLERREQQALRDLPRVWSEEMAARQRAYAANPHAPLHAELLSLALPGHPAVRGLERPGMQAPRRAAAIAAWQRTQHPSRTVHVIHGGFDAVAARRLLQAKFAATALSQPPVVAAAPTRAIANERRSAVPGVRPPTVAIGWLLAPGHSPAALESLARWLGGGAKSRIGRALADGGRLQATVRATAPWPPSLSTDGLLLIEVEDAKDVTGIADLVLRVCKDAAASGPDADEMTAVERELQRARTLVAADPRWLATDLALELLRWPNRPAAPGIAAAPKPAELRALAAAVLGTRPVIVEGRP